MFAQYIRNTVRSTLSTVRSVVLDSDCNPISAEVVGDLKYTRQLATNGDLVVKRTFSAEGVTTLFFRVEWAELVPVTEGATQLKDAIEFHPTLADFMDLKGPDLLPERFCAKGSIDAYRAEATRRGTRDAAIRADLDVVVADTGRELASMTLDSIDAMILAAETSFQKHSHGLFVNQTEEAKVIRESTRKLVTAAAKFGRGVTNVLRRHVS